MKKTGKKMVTVKEFMRGYNEGYQYFYSQLQMATWNFTVNITASNYVNIVNTFRVFFLFCLTFTNQILIKLR